MSCELLRRFDTVAARLGTKTALVSVSDETTYGELARLVDEWSAELAHLGIQAGDRCVVAVEGGANHTALCLALWRRSAALVPLSPDLPHNELAEMTDLAEAEWMITAPGPKDPAASGVRPPVQVAAAPRSTRLHGRDQDEGVLFASSGTTGRVKFAVFTNAAIAANIADQVRAFGLVGTDSVASMVVSPTPGYLTTALWPALTVGASLHELPTGAPGRILGELNRIRPTVVYGIPAVYRLLADSVAARRDPGWASGTRLCLSSSAHLTGTTFDAFERTFGLTIRSLYCSVEGGSVTFDDTDDRRLSRDSVGRPLPGVQLRIVADDGDDCRVGEEGQILVGGTHIASGYAAGVSAGSESTFRTRWVATGDTGFLDEDGFLFLRGRLSSAVNVGGTMVDPYTVEQILLGHPAVLEAYVYAETDPRRGEVLAADVVLTDAIPHKPTARDLTRYCAERLDRRRWVHKIRIRPDLPHSRDGKVRRLPR